ncbi:MAG: hypothetical protein E4H36_07260 [Spirochaetales bacterium]|nr:MAG: hypothetical protein E4H36_07260 [Spirochaetales bacterium]
MPNTAMQNRQLKRILLSVEKPGRYSGGEFGMAPLKKDAALHVAVSYPDLYEIGMSNLAIQILYSRLNAVKDVYCERVFTPAPDFAAGLTKASLPLFSLETGRPLKDFDLLGFSIGYELIITNVLSMLSLSGIPLSWKDRGESDPLIVAGGPAVINPLPFSRFFDAIYIGEAEDEFPQICADLAQIRRDGGKREDLLRHIRASSHFFHQGKREKTSRKVWECFGKDPDEPETVFPVPISKLCRTMVLSR